MGNKKVVGDYYPFGLTMAGISSKALEFGNPENKYKYNGIEYEKDLGLEIYDAQLRKLDGQIGRWWQIDPKTEDMEMWSPYASNYNNPIRYSDPLGDEGQECCQWAKNALSWIGDKVTTVAEYGFGVVTGTAVSVYDNMTGANVRTQLAEHFEGAGAAGHGWNTGLNLGEIGSIALGAVETAVGGGMAGGSGLVLAGTGGTAAPVAVPVAAAGVAVATHGVMTTTNAAENLTSQNGRVNASSSGRNGKQQKLREIADDPKASSADRGWLRQELRNIERKKQSIIRIPPGKVLAHERGREAAKGYSYEYSFLQDKSLHTLQHKYDNKGRKNKERPVK